MIIHRILSLIAVALAVVTIVAVSLGARIDRWEMILWPVTVIFWVGTAWIYEAMARSRP